MQFEMRYMNMILDSHGLLIACLYLWHKVLEHITLQNKLRKFFQYSQHLAEQPYNVYGY
jgi:hypothetical protein